MSSEDSRTSRSLPSGTVTFLFTDIVGSTRMWASDDASMSLSLRLHDECLRRAIESNSGYIFTTAGDSFSAAFHRASDAIAAAQDIQSSVATADWPGPTLTVRIGLHLGESEERDGDYFGPVVNTAARVEAAAHAGQVLLTEPVRAAARSSDITDLGAHRLKDLPERIQLYQLGTESFPPIRSAVRLTNLPPAPSSLVGREEELELAADELTKNRLVTALAVGGSGKTRLAIALGASELERRHHGVWFVDLSTVVNDEEVIPAVAGALGVQLVGSSPIERVLDYLAGKNLLLVLDNCEHVVDEVADFAERFLATPGESVLLATSREPLNIDGEKLFRVEPLGCSSADGKRSPAVRLFIERAQAIEPDFQVNSATEAVLQEICKRLDGIPLAIELAAARISVLSPEELLAGLDDRFQLLSGRRRRRRQRTLEATLDWSYVLLSEEEQRLFRILGAFAGSFDLKAVAALAEVSPHAARNEMEDLIAKSLVVSAPLPGSTARFALLETLKAYAENRLIDSGDARRVRDLHANYFHALATENGCRLAADVRHCQRLSLDRANLATAFHWLSRDNRWPAAGQMVLSSSAGFSHSGEALEARAMAERCAPKLKSTDPELFEKFLWFRSYIAGALDDWPAAVELLQRMLTSNNALIRTVGYGAGAFTSAQSEPDRATDLFESGVTELATPNPDHHPIDVEIVKAEFMVLTSFLWGLQDRFDRVEKACSTALERLTACGHITETWWNATHTAAACRLLDGDFDGAIRRLDQLSDTTWTYGNGDELRAIVLAEAKVLDEATELARNVALEAASGRLVRQYQDAVILMAALLHAEGDDQRARAVLIDAGAGRSFATFFYARKLSSSLGFLDSYLASEPRFGQVEDHRGANTSTLSRPMKALRAEVARREWI